MSNTSQSTTTGKNLASIRWIDNTDALKQLLHDIEHVDWFAIDTEFQRERTYYPQLCLIQIAAGDVVACIDALADIDLDSFLTFLNDTRRIKVFHAARQDLEIFYHLSKQVPQPLFDTQLAAQVLGHADQIGYGKLVQVVLDVELSKSHSRADWTRRPLPDIQLEYAADDVIYLSKMYPVMLQELKDKQRLSWLDEEFAFLTQPSLYDIHAESAWLKIKPLQKMKGAKLSIAQHLAGWREDLAKRIDQPRNWIMSNEVLMDLAHQQPGTIKDLQHIRGLQERTVRRNGQELLALIEKAKTEKPAARTEPGRTRKPGMAQQATLHVLDAILYQCCAEHNISPSAIATRSDLEKFMLDKNNSKLAQGWRYQFAGRHMQAFLDGELKISCQNQQLLFSDDGQ